MQEFVGTVVRGINNIFSVVPYDKKSWPLFEETIYECRIKGKVLQGVPESYNPLAVGDRVLCQQIDAHSGLILERLERFSTFVRWNARQTTNQTVVANTDLVVIVTSADEPPFRPTFVDRAIACTRGAPLLILLNKSDLSLSKEERRRFELYQKVGFETLAISAFKQRDIKHLEKRFKGQLVTFVGQSGVGKSTIVNALLGSELQKVGSISERFNRGRHTTNHALMLRSGDFSLVDTPGVRELLVPHGDDYPLSDAFPEFADFAPQCAFDGCTHYHEPDCAVKDAVEQGKIDEERYESYLRLLLSLEERPPHWQSAAGRGADV